MAGYSATPLERKLGLKSGDAVRLIEAPAFIVDLIQQYGGVVVDEGSADLAIAFVRTVDDLRAAFATLTPTMTPTGAIWLAWPKKASRIPTDITEDRIRDVVLPTGWVDNKVCAVDDTWSGLRVVLRKGLR